ncbi:uncharacterized protein LOC104693367 [Corvus cornix cornix]|uniref:uncharacterized protein LOC104693367 n=1 Tax=Corvus cornix cornix TaxID=932674 RepID=UPI00195284DD|nr:uncharacterized protein LOC104693367 [Corvus cornix cornix]
MGIPEGKGNGEERGWARRAFPKSSGCFQLKSYTATIGSHRGADIVLQVGPRQLSILKRAVVWTEGKEEDVLESSALSAEVPVYAGIDDQKRGLAKQGQTWSHLQQRSLPVPCLLPVRRCGRSSCSPGILRLRQQLRPSGLQLPPRHLCQQLPGPKRGRQGEAGGHPELRHRGSILRAGAGRGCPVSTSVSGNGASAVRGPPSLGTPEVDLLLREKGEKLLEKEMGHLSGLETESKGKNVVIRALQEEIAAMAKKLAQAAVRNEVELTQKLLTFNQELGAQTEEIKALREQINNLQKDLIQAFSQSSRE